MKSQPKPARKPPVKARASSRDARYVSKLLEGLGSRSPLVKYGCAKTLRTLSERRPELLYPHYDFFVRLLDHDNKILQWQAALIVSELSRVDVEDKFSGIFSRYFAPISGPVMITAANVLRGGARIGLARSQLADRIAAEMLKVGRARYQTPECRNVAIGHALTALAALFPFLKQPAPVLRFARRQIHNSRPATRRKAERFLKQLGAVKLRAG